MAAASSSKKKVSTSDVRTHRVPVKKKTRQGNSKRSKRRGTRKKYRGQGK
jgi:hypothetical protein